MKKTAKTKPKGTTKKERGPGSGARSPGKKTGNTAAGKPDGTTGPGPMETTAPDPPGRRTGPACPACGRKMLARSTSLDQKNKVRIIYYHCDGRVEDKAYPGWMGKKRTCGETKKDTQPMNRPA